MEICIQLVLIVCEFKHPISIKLLLTTGPCVSQNYEQMMQILKSPKRYQGINFYLEILNRIHPDEGISMMEC